MSNQIKILHKEIGGLERTVVALKVSLADSNERADELFICNRNARIENEDLKAEVAKFRGKNNYKEHRLKRLIKKGLDRMVEIGKLQTENKKLRGEIK